MNFTHSNIGGMGLYMKVGNKVTGKVPVLPHPVISGVKLSGFQQPSQEGLVKGFKNSMWFVLKY